MMTTQRSRDYDHLEFLLSGYRYVFPAIKAIRSMTQTPTEATGTQEVPLPSNPMQRGRARYKLLSHKYAAAQSRHKMVQSTANYEQKLAEADATGFVWVHPRGQIGNAPDSEWYAFMHGLLDEIRERLEALNKRLSFLLLAIDPVEPQPALAENDARRVRQLPAADIPRILKQLTDTVVIAPGAPARA
jgi:hypothetical protein